MARKRIDLIGVRFGRLIVTDRIEKMTVGHVYWRCVCDCGRKPKVAHTNLQTGGAVHCGRKCPFRTPPGRKPLKLSHATGASPAEIATTLGVSVSTVYRAFGRRPKKTKKESVVGSA